MLPSEVPFITPTASIPDIRRYGRYWFSTTLTIPLQVRNLVDYAMQRLGQTRFSILAPDTSYGREIGKEFHRYVQENGGYIIASQLYTKGTTDASRQILRIKDRDLSLLGEMVPLKNEKGEEQFIYSPGFDAVFLPGRPLDVAFLSAQLAFYDVKGYGLAPHSPYPFRSEIWWITPCNAWAKPGLAFWPPTRVTEEKLARSFIDMSRKMADISSPPNCIRRERRMRLGRSFESRIGI